jgi:hypothetical protein
MVPKSIPARLGDLFTGKVGPVRISHPALGFPDHAYEKWRQIGEDHGEVLLPPPKVDVQVVLFALAWTPARA